MWFGMHVHVCVFLACCLSEDRPCSLSSLLQIMVVDGDSGSVIWSYSAPCHMKETPTTSAVTSDQKSVFLFWAEEPPATSPSSDAIPGTEPFSLHHLYLLHPTFPSILLDLANATGTVTASEGQSQCWWGSVYTHEAGAGCV